MPMHVKGLAMRKSFHKNTKALSTLVLILLLLISAIIGGVFSYLWAMGYYLSLKEIIPDKSTASIVDVRFPPQNATAFNVTVLNPSFSPDEFIQVDAIAFSVKGDVRLYPASSVLPALPFNISRGSSRTFTVRAFWASFVNRTLIVSVFVKNGTGSTVTVNVPYIRLLIDDVDFNPVLGVKNFTVSLRNDPSSATYLNVTNMWIDEYELTNYTQPRFPYGLSPSDSKTFTLNSSWVTYATIGGTHNITVRTFQGYVEVYTVLVPRLAFSVQEITFNPTDTTHFTVNVTNHVSTNTYLNVSRIEVLMENGTTRNVTPALNSSTNGVLGNLTKTFTINWNWTTYRNKNAIVTVYMLQGVKESGQKRTPLAAMLSIPEEPVFADTDHFFVTVQNSPYSIKTANVTKITVTFENGTEKSQNLITQPPSGPYLIRIGETTMFGCSWNWTTYLNKTVNINVYTDEGFATFRVVRTPVNTLNYTVYLNVSSTVFNPSFTTQFNATIYNSAASARNANITRISILLANGTEIDAIITSQVVAINTSVTFTCQLNWADYRGKSIVIRVYTDEGLKAIYKTTLP